MNVWEKRECRIEITDAARFDKDVLGRHAPGAHLLRPRLACYTLRDLDLDIAAPSSRQEGFGAAGKVRDE